MKHRKFNYGMFLYLIFTRTLLHITGKISFELFLILLTVIFVGYILCDTIYDVRDKD